MAKRSKMVNTERKVREERGFGQGKDYKPWITIQDFPSNGRVSRIKGIKTKRQHEFLSDLERNYFYYLEFSDSVIDIREQFPLLPLEETLFIAKELGIKHPEHPQTKDPIVMTTDFLITVKNLEKAVKEVARTLKYKEKLLDKRVLEKFEIERVYFERHQIDWGIVTEEQVNKTVAQNLADFHRYEILKEFEEFVSIEEEVLEDIKYAFINKIIDYTGSLRNLCSSFDKDMGLTKGSSIALLKHLIIKKILLIDIDKPFNMSHHQILELNIKKAEKEAEIG